MLYNEIPKSIAGTAMAGFGLSFGRDIYKKGKNALPQLIAILIAILFLLLCRQSMVWAFRNYRSIGMALMVRAITIPLFFIGSAVSMMVLWLVSGIIIDVFFSPNFPNKIIDHIYYTYANILLLLAYISDPLFSADGEIVASAKELWSADLESRYYFAWAFIIYLLLIVSGIIAGVKQRKPRRIAWEAEEHNKRFMAENGIIEMGEDQFKDAEGNLYRLKNLYSDRMELLAIGRRNKRGYITFDANGKFENWSGLVSIS